MYNNSNNYDYINPKFVDKMQSKITNEIITLTLYALLEKAELSSKNNKMVYNW